MGQKKFNWASVAPIPVALPPSTAGEAAVPIACAGRPTLDQYWEDGPQFTGWGQIVGKYPDGTPAIVEGLSGKGWVVLCGVHSVAPANWRKE